MGKVLKLTLTKQWFDLILTGEKVFEYREYKKHWMQRLLGKDYDQIEFINGYGLHRPTMRVVCEGVAIMAVEHIQPDNGEQLDAEKKYFVIALGEVVSACNLDIRQAFSTARANT